ncbi:SIMPL domain-containing protein [Salinimicrobium sp. GXAS 041]|uniref:SIMPL domain-containing protein n=1 Tax=Salinimicrobium sp. GXAS 041 TaxID=3400806 RepID=UPI003C73AB3C
MRKISILLTILFSIVGFAQQQNYGVTVTGEGTVYVVPNEVVIRARVEHSGESASEVKMQNDEVVSKILKFLKNKGILSKNVRTEYINLNKDYNYNTKEYSYSANQAISIHLEELDSYEEIMAGLLESGLNRIDAVNFKTSRQEEIKSEARKLAVLNAKEKASELVQPLGQKLGQAFQISEVENARFVPVMQAMEMKSDRSGGEQTIAPGELEVTVKINVSFLLL